MKTKDEKTNSVFFTLNALWAAFTLLLIIIVYSVLWQKERVESRQTLLIASQEVRDQLDDFIDELQTTLYIFTKMDAEKTKCSTNLLARLQHTVYNHPFLSGIVIKNRNNQTICSTLATDVPSNHGEQRTTGILGPVKLSYKDKPAFIVQQKIGSFTINLYLLKHILEQKLQNLRPIAHTIALYEVPSGEIILQVSRDLKSNNWQSSPSDEYLTTNQLVNEDLLITKTRLNSFDNYEVVLLGDPKAFNNIINRHKILAVILVLILSGMFYYLLKQIIDRLLSLNYLLYIATKRNQFFPVYQPIHEHGEIPRIAGFEVLTRWRTNNNATVMPNSFIPEAERSGLIVPITLQLMEKTFKEMHPILEKDPNLYLSFNICTLHFTDPNFFKSFESLYQQHQISPKQILLELTERDLLSQYDDAITNTMTSLRAKGLSLAVDDFGTGHASISYLRHFPFNYLKIDRIFISAIGTGAITETLNKSIIQMAKNLNLNIIAEGVELATQVEFLEEYGISLMQGWYFSHPMPIESLIEFLKGFYDD